MRRALSGDSVRDDAGEVHTDGRNLFLTKLLTPLKAAESLITSPADMFPVFSS